MKSTKQKNAHASRAVKYEYSGKYNKADKQLAKAKEYKKQADAFQVNMKKAESDTWKTIAELSERGYTMTSKETIRNGEKAASHAMALLGGAGGAVSQQSYNKAAYKDEYQTTYRGKSFNQNPSMIVGKKYKVKK